MKTSVQASGAKAGDHALTRADLLMVVAVLSVLAAIVIPILVKTRASRDLAQCKANLKQIGRAVQLYAEENNLTFPILDRHRAPGGWWWYKEQVKSYAGLKGPSSTQDTLFACARDRGYDEAGEKIVPFAKSAKHNYTSYVFNGVNLPGLPNIAGWKVPAVKNPARTLSVMEWSAHAPLSWHKSRTGKANAPFYNDAESVVSFVDGHVGFIPIYFDGINAAYTRDPIGGYDYQYSGN